MKLKRWILSLGVVGWLVTLGACGAAEPIIETPAGEMNFTAADLGARWSLQSEQGLSELMTDVPDHALDANVRSFVASDALEVLVGMTLSTKSVASAERELKGSFVQDIMTSLQEMGSDGTFEEMDPPDVGDEAIMIGGQTSISDVAVDAYALTFRKANVIAMVFLIGPEDFANSVNVTQYGEDLEARIQ